MAHNVFSSSEALTFSDVLLVPQYSETLPSQVETFTHFSKKTPLNIPVISAAMDTVTEHKMAIKIAQNGGIGCIHKNFTIEKQCEEVRKVKRFESGIITDPIIIFAKSSVEDALRLMSNHSISGLPVLDENQNLQGIITNRDIRFLHNLSVSVESTKECKGININPF